MRDALTIRAYAPGDELEFEAREDFAEALRQEGGVLPPGPKFTLAAARGVIGIGGFEPLDGRRRWGAWAYLSDLSDREWAFAARCAMERLAALSAARPGARIQAIAAAGPPSVALLKRIGFVAVGELYMIWEG